MKSILYRCNESKHRALVAAAKSEQISLQKLFDGFTSSVIADRQAEARFRTYAQRGNPERSRKLLQTIRKRLEAAG